MSPTVSESQSPIPSTPKSLMPPKVNSFTDGSPSMSPIPKVKSLDPFISGSPPTPSTPKSSMSPKVNPFIIGSPGMSPIPKADQCTLTKPKRSNSFIAPTPSTPVSFMSPKVNPFQIRRSISPIPIRYEDSPKGLKPPKGLKEVIARSLPPPLPPRGVLGSVPPPLPPRGVLLPNGKPTPAGYQCPPSTPASCVTPRVQLEDSKYSPLQKSPGFSKISNPFNIGSPITAGYTCSPSTQTVFITPKVQKPVQETLEFNNAINYVNQIKSRFAGQPGVYKQFIELLITCLAYQKDQRAIKEGPSGQFIIEGESFAQLAKLFPVSIWLPLFLRFCFL